MPHDKRGTELHVGDTVMVPCIVKAIHLTEDYCNVDLETKLTMPPMNTVSKLTLNSRQTIKPTATHQFVAAEGRSEGRALDPKLLAIAGLVNGYHNDGATLTADETLRAIADVLGKAMEDGRSDERATWQALQELMDGCDLAAKRLAVKTGDALLDRQRDGMREAYSDIAGRLRQMLPSASGEDQ